MHFIFSNSHIPPPHPPSPSSPCHTQFSWPWSSLKNKNLFHFFFKLLLASIGSKYGQKALDTPIASLVLTNVVGWFFLLNVKTG